MKNATSSITAEATLVFRAVESRRPPTKRIANDYLAPLFLPPQATVIGRTKIPEPIARWLYNLGFPGVETYLATRTRYFDECFKTSIENGITQVVVLGAGYDSRAYRFSSINPDCCVFEVDHPATQQVKKEVVRRCFGELPKQIQYVPIDFHQESLECALHHRGYDATAQTLFLWEGVTYYISSDAVDATLKYITRNSARKSLVVFDYTLPQVIEGRCWRREAILWRKTLVSRGEPILFGIENDTIQAFLSKRGFCKIRTHDPRSLFHQYLHNRSLRRKPSPIFSIATANVA